MHWLLTRLNICSSPFFYAIWVLSVKYHKSHSLQTISATQLYFSWFQLWKHSRLKCQQICWWLLFERSNCIFLCQEEWPLASSASSKHMKHIYESFVFTKWLPPPTLTPLQWGLKMEFCEISGHRPMIFH